MKKPWLAALLNFIPLGFGYLYLGRLGRWFALSLAGGIVAAVAGYFIFFIIMIANGFFFILPVSRTK